MSDFEAAPTHCPWCGTPVAELRDRTAADPPTTDAELLREHGDQCDPDPWSDG